MVPLEPCRASAVGRSAAYDAQNKRQTGLGARRRACDIQTRSQYALPEQCPNAVAPVPNHIPGSTTADYVNFCSVSILGSETPRILAQDFNGL